MKTWEKVSEDKEDKKTDNEKKRIARKPKEKSPAAKAKEKIKPELVEKIVKKVVLSALLVSASSVPAWAQKDSPLRAKLESCRDSYANLMAPKFSYMQICNAINETTFEDVAWDRTAFVFKAVVDTMNVQAERSAKVWKTNPRQKTNLVRHIFKEVTGQSKFAPSCIATCSYSVFTAFAALEDDGTEIVPKKGATYGNAFLEDKEVRKYTVSVAPGTDALERAIEENNIQPGDFILVPRNKMKYHTIMYVGRDANGNHLYSANNNPAVKKNVSYYNGHLKKWGRHAKIVKLNEMYKDRLVAKMQQMETEGIAKEDIIRYMYSTMGEGMDIFNEAVKRLNKLDEINQVPVIAMVDAEKGKKEKEDMDKLFEHVIKKDIGREMAAADTPTKQRVRSLLALNKKMSGKDMG